jgi:hypothetical protein
MSDQECIEQEVMDALVLAVNKYKELISTHPSHDCDFTNGIHQCQNVLIHKIVQRDYPDRFPTHTKAATVDYSASKR